MYPRNGLKILAMVIHLTNREFLRNFRKFRKKLSSGEVEAIVLPEENGRVIKLISEEKKTPFENFLEKVRQKPLDVKRPEEDIF